MDNLDAYWYVLDSKTTTNIHVFELEELNPGDVYVFRIEQTYPAKQIEPARKWQIADAAAETLVLLNTE